MELLTFIIPVILAISIYFLLFRNKRGNFPPGPRPFPIIGNILDLREAGKSVYVPLTKLAEKYGHVFRIFAGRTPLIVLSDPQIIREAFNHPFLNGRPDNKVFRAASGGAYGVLIVDGPNWTEQRRFTIKHLRDFGFGKKEMESLILEEAKDLIDSFKLDEGKAINPVRRFNLAVLNSLWVIVTGNRIDQDNTEVSNMLEDYFMNLSNVFVKSPLCYFPILADIFPERSGWNAFNKSIQRATGFFKSVIAEHEKELDDNEPKDYIDAYLKEMRKADDPSSSFFKDTGNKNLLAIVGDLFAAGGETTSATLSWAVLYLATYRDIQTKLHEEIDSVLGNRLPSLSDKAQMPYTEATMLEIFRRSSIAAMGLWHRAVQDTQFRGYDIEKGTILLANIHCCHHNPKIWGDPETFRPERFLSPDGKKIVKNDALIPFAVGKRICLGKTLAEDEFFLFLTSLFQRFEFSLDPSQGPVTLEPLPSFVLQPVPYYVILKDRNL